MQISSREFRLPFLLFMLTFLAILACIARLVVLETVPVSDLDALDQRYNVNSLATTLHVLPGLIFLLVGLVQFMPAIRRCAINLHRWMGRAFIVSGLVSGLAIYWLAYSLPAMGGTPTIAGVWVFSTAMNTFLIIAWLAIRRMDIARHRAFMIRAYAVGSAVATTRLLGILGDVVLGLDFAANFAIWVWASMLLHMIGAELLLSRGKWITRFVSA